MMPTKATNAAAKKGLGSIYQRKDGYWVASLFIRKGKRKNVYGKTPHEVQTKLLALHNERQAQLPPASSDSLQKQFDWWLTCTVAPTVDPATLALYRQRAKQYIYPALGGRPLNSLETWDIETFLQSLPQKSADLRHKLGELLRRFFKYASKRRLVRENVASGAALPKVVTENINPLSERQLQAFLREARTNHHYDLYVLALDSGARQGELFALEWTDLDLDTGVLFISKTVQLNNGRHRLKEVKTKAGRRRLRLAPTTLALLAARKLTSTSRLIFPNRKGRYLQRENVRKHSFKPILARAGLSSIRFHDLRHTAATLWLLKTKNIKAVSARLGHADIRVTLNTYAHYLPAMEDELVAAMDQILQPKPPVM